MTLASNILPYGLRDVKLYPIDDTGAIGNGVDLPAAQVFSFSEAEEFTELRGDDGVVAIRGKGPKCEWELEAGGISFDAYKVMAGGTDTTTGTTPNQVRSFKKKTTDARPYFAVRGQSISDSGGNFHGLLFKARATGALEGKQEDGAFRLTKAKGDAIGSNGTGVPDVDDLYEFRQFETTTAIPTTWD